MIQGDSSPIKDPQTENPTTSSAGQTVASSAAAGMGYKRAQLSSLVGATNPVLGGPSTFTSTFRSHYAATDPLLLFSA